MSRTVRRKNQNNDIRDWPVYDFDWSWKGNFENRFYTDNYSTPSGANCQMKKDTNRSRRQDEYRLIFNILKNEEYFDDYVYLEKVYKALRWVYF